MLAYMRSHRRRAAPEQVLIVGLHDDIDAIATTLAQVSPDAYGHVLIAAPPGATDADGRPADGRDGHAVAGGQRR